MLWARKGFLRRQSFHGYQRKNTEVVLQSVGENNIPDKEEMWKGPETRKEFITKYKNARKKPKKTPQPTKPKPTQIRPAHSWLEINSLRG